MKFVKFDSIDIVACFEVFNHWTTAVVRVMQCVITTPACVVMEIVIV